MLRFKGAYIGGRFIAPKKKSWIKLDPGNTDRAIGHWGPTEDKVEEAVDAAQKAFGDWAWLSKDKRSVYFKRFQRVLKERKRKLAETISGEMGKPLFESLAEIDTAVKKVEVTMGGGLSLLRLPQPDPRRQTRFHPRGVLAVISPFNFPIQLATAQLIPALATGNTVVLKPSEITPFTCQALAECFHAAGFPKGVFNLLQGGGEVGARLVRSRGIKGVLFVGSEATGRKIQEQVQGEFQKICVLEMGGKNAALIFEDADLEAALEASLVSAFVTTGQRCNALSRILLEESIAPRFIDRFAAAASRWPIGYAFDPKSRMGPLANEAAMEKFLKYQRLARREGVQTLLEGKKVQRDFPGYYVSPSLHQVERWKPQADRRGYRYDEIFGPDVCFYTFKNLEEAIRIHNDSRYGLVASLFTRKKSVFEEGYRRLEVGLLHWNRPTIGSSPYLPFGGIKASGNHFPAGILSPFYCIYPVGIQG